MSKMTPTQLSDEAVNSLHARWRAKLAAEVDAALPEGADESLRKAVEKLVIHGHKCRDKLPAAELKAVAARGAEACARAMLDIDPPFDAREVMDFYKTHADRPTALNWPEVFGKRDRVYLPVLPPRGMSGTERRIRDLLEGQEGWQSIDYKAGRGVGATGEERKLGRALKQLDPHLFTAFTRQTRDTDDLMIVLSRDALDIARMSTGRGWRSCMNKDDHFFKHYVNIDLKRGTVIAYLCKRSDPDITDPLGRVLVKPYTDDKGRHVLMAEKLYGLGAPGFVDTVQGFLDARHNRDCWGMFSLDTEFYADFMNRNRPRLPDGATADDLLRLLGVPTRKGEDGRVIVEGDLDLSGLGLTRLPDLSHVEVTGNFDCSHNDLTDLKGCPAVIGRSLIAQRNRLSSLEGAPAHLGGDLDVQDNQLTSLEHAPRHVGASVFAQKNRLVTLKGCPDTIGHALNLISNRLTSPEGIGAQPGQRINMGSNPLTHLAGLPADWQGKLLTPLGSFNSTAEIPANLLTPATAAP